MLPVVEFELLVENALRGIPWRFRRRMKNVALVVEQEPPRPGLLGLYQGRPLANRSVFEGFTMPDKTQFTRVHTNAYRAREHSLSRWWLTRSGMRLRTTLEWTKHEYAGRSGRGELKLEFRPTIRDNAAYELRSQQRCFSNMATRRSPNVEAEHFERFGSRNNSSPAKIEVPDWSRSAIDPRRVRIG